MTASVVGAADFHVGDGQPFASISAVPWESLYPGDTVFIHWRATPYREKWVMGRDGAAGAPITVRGVAGPNGEMPIIDGNNATTRLALDFWSEQRGVIKIGGANIPDSIVARHIVIENLDIRGARPPNTFTDEAGAVQSYPNNAAAIFVERGEDITIRGCIVHDCGNGLFVASGDDETSADILIEKNDIHDNGNVGSLFEHNTYTAAIGITYQFNRFGPLRVGASGNNLKDRSAGLVVRYNWIESGNRQLDLVDGEDSVLIRNHPTYGQTFAYGNILIEPEGAGNRQIVHYGGDSTIEEFYRKGTLYFYHNTVVSTRSNGMTLMRLSTNDEHCDARNNIAYVTAAGNTLALLDETGFLDITHNWFKPGWRLASGTLLGMVIDDGTSITGSTPGFENPAAQDLDLASGSACIDAAAALHPVSAAAQPLNQQYAVPQQGTPRSIVGAASDLGAFERGRPFDCDVDGDVDLFDFAAYVACATGPVSPPGGIPSGCACSDGDHDLDVDMRDLGQFLLAAGGIIP